MNGRVLLLLCILSFASAATAQELPKSFHDCWEKAQYQSEMNACAASEAKKAEDLLNNKYKEALSLTRNRETPDQVAAAVRAIEVAQAAWVRYSAAYLEAMYPGDESEKQKQYGTMYVAGVEIVRLRLALRQIAAMDDLIEQFRPK